MPRDGPVVWPQSAVTRLHWAENLLGLGVKQPPLPCCHEGPRVRHEGAKPGPGEHLGTSHIKGWSSSAPQNLSGGILVTPLSQARLRLPMRPCVCGGEMVLISYLGQPRGPISAGLSYA